MPNKGKKKAKVVEEDSDLEIMPRVEIIYEDTKYRTDIPYATRSEGPRCRLGGFTPFWKHIEIIDYKGIHETGVVPLRRGDWLDFT